MKAAATRPAHLIQDLVEALGEGFDVVVVAKDGNGGGAQLGPVVKGRRAVMFPGKAL